MLGPGADLVLHIYGPCVDHGWIMCDHGRTLCRKFVDNIESGVDPVLIMIIRYANHV